MNKISTAVKLSRFSRDELQALTSTDRRPSVSLYMPTHRAGKEIRQDPIRLKNLISQATDQLSALSMEETQIEKLLEFANALPQNEVDTFWQHGSDGLAVFLQEGFSRGYRLPISFDELVVVADRFHVKPLLPYLQGDGHFYLLAVSSKHVRLFEGGKHQLTEIDTDILPNNLVDALNIDEYVSSLQLHSHSTTRENGAADATAIFHGHGAGSDTDKKEELLKYFRILDDAINEFMDAESAPMVFAGVEYLFPIYQQANNYRNLVDEPLTGNHDDTSPDELHAKAWEIVGSRFASHQRKLLERFGLLASQGKASDDFEHVIEAAREGRIETLLVEKGERRWGVISEAGAITQTDANSAESEDILDYAAVHAIRTGSEVFLIEKSSMPTDSPVAALFRY